MYSPIQSSTRSPVVYKPVVCWAGSWLGRTVMLLGFSWPHWSLYLKRIWVFLFLEKGDNSTEPYFGQDRPLHLDGNVSHHTKKQVRGFCVGENRLILNLENCTNPNFCSRKFGTLKKSQSGSIYDIRTIFWCEYKRAHLLFNCIEIDWNFVTYFCQFNVKMAYTQVNGCTIAAIDYNVWYKYSYSV